MEGGGAVDSGRTPALPQGANAPPSSRTRNAMQESTRQSAPPSTRTRSAVRGRDDKSLSQAAEGQGQADVLDEAAIPNEVTKLGSLPKGTKLDADCLQDVIVVTKGFHALLKFGGRILRILVGDINKCAVALPGLKEATNALAKVRKEQRQATAGERNKAYDKARDQNSGRKARNKKPEKQAAKNANNKESAAKSADRKRKKKPAAKSAHRK